MRPRFVALAAPHGAGKTERSPRSRPARRRAGRNRCRLLRHLPFRPVHVEQRVAERAVSVGAGHEAIGTVARHGRAPKLVHVGQTVGWLEFRMLPALPPVLTGKSQPLPTLETDHRRPHGASHSRVRLPLDWATPIPDGLDRAKAGPLLCGGITVFNPLLQFACSPPTAWASSASAGWATWRSSPEQVGMRGHRLHLHCVQGGPGAQHGRAPGDRLALQRAVSPGGRQASTSSSPP